MSFNTKSTTILDAAAKTKNKRIAFVTGSNKGIGKEIVRRLHNEPDIITIVACRDPELGKAACEEIQNSSTIESESDSLQVCQLDLTNDDDIQSAANFILQKYGKLDILINNAAICFNDPTLYGKLPYTKFEDQADITIKTNFFGTYKVTEAMLPLLLKSKDSHNKKSPRIINIASSAGRLSILKSQQLIDFVTSPTISLAQLSNLMTDFVKCVQTQTHAGKGYPNTCYGMSKLGIIAMTKIFAKKYPELQIHSVDPGYCATDQNNSQGSVAPERGALTPFLLSTLDDEQIQISGGHFFEEREITW